MVTVQEAPIVNPPETTGTSAKEELPKSGSPEPLESAKGNLQHAETYSEDHLVRKHLLDISILVFFHEPGFKWLMVSTPSCYAY
jgi:hypothetical protein